MTAAWRNPVARTCPSSASTAPPCYRDRTGRVVLAGLPEPVVAEVLYAIQASVAEGRRVMVKDVRAAAQLLRRSGVRSIADLDTAGRRDPVRWFLRFAADRAALARADPETEAVKDVWDLRVFGAVGRLSFVGSITNHGTASRPITQPWLKHAAQVWAAEALTGMTSGPVRAVIARRRVVVRTPGPARRRRRGPGRAQPPRHGRVPGPAHSPAADRRAVRGNAGPGASTASTGSCGTAGRWV